MSKLTFIFRTDVHASDKSPESWKGDYPEEIWSNLEQIGKLVEDHKATAVLDGGDFFHVKAASRNSHALTRHTAEIHKRYKCPIYSIVGNHDIIYNSLESLERQPLGVMFESGVFKQLKEEVFRDGDLQVRVVGLSYKLDLTTDDFLAIQKKPGDDFLVVVAHTLATEKSSGKEEDFWGEPVFNYKDLVIPNGPDVLMFGHWHKDQGVVKIKGKYFVNQGAVSRGALTHENTERTPKVALLEFSKSSGIVIKVLPLNVAPAKDVFDFEKKERVESEQHSIDAFVERLQEDMSFNSEATIDANIRALNFAVEVRNLALEYLEQARNIE